MLMKIYAHNDEFQELMGRKKTKEIRICAERRLSSIAYFKAFTPWVNKFMGMKIDDERENESARFIIARM